jgi:conjugative relaxase-like TrwC/TraI family protein
LLTLSRNKTAWSASKYYVETLREYYGDKGEWYGEVSRTLGIEGDGVDEMTYLSLAAGINPVDGSTMVQSKKEMDRVTGEVTNEKHRALFDMTFSLPKSGSIAAFVDPEIATIWRDSVKEGLDYYQGRYMQTRIQRDYEKTIENTGKGLFAMFQHDHNRNGEFNTHIHVNVFNIVERADGKFSSHHNDLTFIDQKELGTLIRGMAVRRYREAGYAIEISDRKDLLFEFSGFREIAGQFSTRREEIEAKVLELKESGEFPNASDARLREIANKLTRKGKEHFGTREEVIEHGNRILAEKGYSPEMLMEILEKGKREPQIQRDQDQAITAMGEGLKVLQESEEAWREIHLHTAAARIAGGLAREEIEAGQGELVEKGELVYLGNKSLKKSETPMYTTSRMIEVKNEVYRAVAAGKGGFTPQTDPVEIENWLVTVTDSEGKRIILNEGQRDYFEKALLGTCSTLLVQGDPGTGKTFLRGLIARFDREVLAKRGGGHYTIGTAFTGKAASELEGAGAGPSYTIDSFLNREFEFVDRRDLIENGQRIHIPRGANLEIAVDEASMTGLNQLAEVIEKAERIRGAAEREGLRMGVKISLTGDSKQMQAIAAGRIFQDLWQHGRGMDRTHLKDIIRQKDEWYLSITRQLNREEADIQKRAADALNVLEKAEKKGRICELEESEILGHAAARYLELSAQKKPGGDEASMNGVVVTARNSDKETLNQMIRSARVERGEIGEGTEYTVLKSAGLSTEDKALADRYEPGILIRFNGMKWVVRDNTMGKVVGFDRESNTVQVELDKSSLSRGYDGRLNSRMESTRDRQVISIDVAREFDKIGAFREDRIKISVGDEIRFTDNDKRLGVKNGHSGMVKAMDEDGRVTVYSHELKRDVVFSLHDSMDEARRYKHVALGYAVSTEGSQGMTRDFVIGALNVKPQPASNELHVLIRETGTDCTNRQFDRWNRDLSEFESGYEKPLSLRDKEGKEWKSSASIAVADIAKNGEGPQYTKVVTLRFDDYTVSHKGGEEVRNDLKEHGFWYNQTSGMWLTPVTSEKGMKFLSKDHPLKGREYLDSIRSHLAEVKTEGHKKEPDSVIKAPEAPSYGRYTYNAMNVILTRGRHHFDLVTNDRETLKKEIRNMARKESLQDYMAVQIPTAPKDIDHSKAHTNRLKMNATLDNLIEKNGKIKEMEKGTRFEIGTGKPTPEQTVKGGAMPSPGKSPDREIEITR